MIRSFSLFASPRYAPIDLTSGEQFTNEGRKIRKPALPRPPPDCSTGTIRPREPSLPLSSVCLQALSLHAAEFLQLPCYGTRRPLASFHVASFCAQKLRSAHHVFPRSVGGKEKKTRWQPMTSPMLDFSVARNLLLLLLVDHCPRCVGKRIEKYRKERERENACVYVCMYVCINVCTCVCIYIFMRLALILLLLLKIVEECNSSSRKRKKAIIAERNRT